MTYWKQLIAIVSMVGFNFSDSAIDCRLNANLIFDNIIFFTLVGTSIEYSSYC
jgi:hypothetical protein